MDIAQKRGMLGHALQLRGINRDVAFSIITVLSTDDEFDDMSWYMGQHPNAKDGELLAVAYQLAKETREKRGK